MKEKLIPILVLVIFATVVGILVYSRKEDERTIDALMSMDPQQVTIFKIYPGVAYGPFGTPVVFNIPDPIIDEFFHALTDHNSYPISRDRIASQDHNWFLEIATEGVPATQISFLIPSGKGNIAVGRVGEFSEKGYSYDATFQSKLLYQWYQKYSHRWLTPEGAPDP